MASSAASSTARQVSRVGHKVSVILRGQLDNLGYSGQEVQVVPGYARNFLIPKQLAVYATELNRAAWKKELSADDAAQKMAERARNMLQKRIANIILIFSRATSDGQALYGAITRADIVEAMADTPLRNLKIKEANVRIGGDAAVEQALKTVGDHVIEVEPARIGYPDQWFQLKLRVRSS